MLKKPQRLTSKFHFNIAKKYGRRESFDLFNTITLQARNFVGPSKIGFVVPNSIHKRAIKRNKIKRQLREAIRKNLKRIPDNLWVVIFAKNNILNKKYEEISSQIDRFIQKISLPH